MRTLYARATNVAGLRIPGDGMNPNPFVPIKEMLPVPIVLGEMMTLANMGGGNPLWGACFVFHVATTIRTRFTSLVAICSCRADDVVNNRDMYPLQQLVYAALKGETVLRYMFAWLCSF